MENSFLFGFSNCVSDNVVGLTFVSFKLGFILSNWGWHILRFIN